MNLDEILAKPAREWTKQEYSYVSAEIKKQGRGKLIERRSALYKPVKQRNPQKERP